MKEICNELEDKNCYFRHPKEDFVKYLDQETVDKLIEIGFLKNSPSSGKLWDYKRDCYEYSKKFKNIIKNSDV